ncbi:sodium/glutamate symporter [Georgenia sp. 10Sc9-8]|uniref:Sodium/glutamate symporter n=1 Tax=Georgenia halotolerans TaxID=3028317 RepID=A0ABT5U1M6_9MICO|nr:sodium/glutamate symporter [Georgenia halotolerans]
MSADTVGFALLLLGVVLLVGKVIRIKARWTQHLFLPSSIIAGFLALLLGPEVLGALATTAGVDGLAAGGVFSEEILEVWSILPGLLISVVFATLFLGHRIPNPVRAARLTGPQLSVGVTLASGQYVLGLLLAVLVLAPVFGISPMAGALIEIGFEGGHGTAAGMAPVMDELGFPEGGDLALGIATIGLVSGIVIGVAAINWAVRTGRTVVITGQVKQSVEEQKGLFRKDEQYPAAMMTTRPASVEPLALHFAVVALAILLGWLVLSGLQQLEQLLWADTVELLAFVPLFPLAMLGGVAVQVFLDRTGNTQLVDERMMVRIQGLALDLLIVSALATISVTAIADNLGPFLILVGAGVLFNVLVLLLLIPRTIPQYWFERGIGDFGQSMGVTATGLILMRIVDPDGKSPAFEAFGYKQLLFEPFFGGGLITATAIPLIYQFGPWPLLSAMAVLFVVSALTGLLYFGRQKWDVDAERNQPATEEGHASE